uniref:Uncharacterized protein n=1 Tax=Arundo donax TaxID=35708 RepID=A0A0A8Y2R4_ARUDO
MTSLPSLLSALRNTRGKRICGYQLYPLLVELIFSIFDVPTLCNLIKVNCCHKSLL